MLIELVSENEKEINKCLENIANLDADISLLNTKQSNELWNKREDIPVKLADLNAYKLDICVPTKIKNFHDIYEIKINNDL